MRLTEAQRRNLQAARGTQAPKRTARSTEPQGDTSPMVALALQIARQDFLVFPVARETKRPLTSNGFKNASTSPRQIERWWERWPDANPAIDCGRSNLVVIDSDTRAGFAQLCADLKQDLPDTFTVETGHGYHYYFQAPDGQQIGNTGALKARGYPIDVRGDGGYVVGPGAIHATGAIYTVTNRTPPQPIPDWLLELLPEKRGRATGTTSGRATQATHATADDSAITPKQAQAALAAAVRDLAQARPGERNNTLNAKAHRIGRMVAGGLLERDQVEEDLHRAAIDAGLEPEEATKTIESGLNSGSTAPRHLAPTQVHLDDSRLSEHTAQDLAVRFCWSGGMGWLQFNGKVWKPATDAAVTEAVRQSFTDLIRQEAEGADADRIKRLAVLRTVSKIRAVVGLLRGILEVRPDEFDNHPDYLNCNNGVVDLSTGELLPHDAQLRLTKVTGVDYKPEAKSKDWAQALQALPAEVADWLQLRFGQAASGHMTPDDVMPVLQGNGSNGKSTVVEAIRSTLGDHAVIVPERVLLANPSDHPTELTTLHGARLALIEETPEGRKLSVKRLKDTLGTPTLTARKIQKDNITWQATHTLFLTSNYRPRVSETDHGTWRRLALVRFPFTFRRPGEDLRSEWDREGDPRLRDRLRTGKKGQREAVLAWVVQGALRWYQADQVLPPQPDQVRADTEQWRAGSDLVLAYATEHLEFDPRSKVLSQGLFEHFNAWLAEHGHEPWGDQLFTDRFGGHDEITGHDVHKVRTKALSGLVDHNGRPVIRLSGTRERVWVGVRFQEPVRGHSDALSDAGEGF